VIGISRRYDSIELNPGGVSPFSGNLLFLSDIAQAVGTHEDEQEGESAAFRAAKGALVSTLGNRMQNLMSSH
jgi:hypothetical protein